MTREEKVAKLAELFKVSYMGDLDVLAEQLADHVLVDGEAVVVDSDEVRPVGDVEDARLMRRVWLPAGDRSTT